MVIPYDDLSSDYFFIESYPVDDVYGFITNTDLDTPFIAFPSQWGHGDMVAKKFFENLENPNDTYVLLIGITIITRILVICLWIRNRPTNFEKIVVDYLDLKSSLWPENEFNLIGYSFSWGGLDNSHLSTIWIRCGIMIVQSSPLLSLT